jgi:hypothetical protein
MKELNAEWTILKSRGVELLEKSIPSYNKKLWDAGVGALWKN